MSRCAQTWGRSAVTRESVRGGMDATTIGARVRGSTRYPNWFESSWVRTVAGLEAGGRPLTLPLRQGPRRPPSAGGRLQRPQNAYGVAAGAAAYQGSKGSQA